MQTPKANGNNTINVLIVDDHEIMRQGLTQLINQETDMIVCAEAEDAAGALDAMSEHQPNIAVVDISLKDSSGIELIKDIMVRWPGFPVLVLSMHEESFYAERVLRAGAKGYVSKAEVSSKVVDGIRTVLKGDLYVSEKLASKLLSGIVGGSAPEVSPIDRLSDREFEVFEMIGRGQQMRDIASKLHLSVKTVEAHREHIKKKLNLDSANELLTYALQWAQLERDA